MTVNHPQLSALRLLLFNAYCSFALLLPLSAVRSLIFSVILCYALITLLILIEPEDKHHFCICPLNKTTASVDLA